MSSKNSNREEGVDMYPSLAYTYPSMGDTQSNIGAAAFSLSTTRRLGKTNTTIEMLYPMSQMLRIKEKINSTKIISFDEAIFILGGNGSSSWMRTPINCFSYYPAPKDQLGTVTKYEEALLASSNERHMDLIRFMAADSIRIHHDDRGYVEKDMKLRYLAGPNSYSRDKLNSFMDSLSGHPRYNWTMGCFVFSDRIQTPGRNSIERGNNFYNIPTRDGTVFRWKPTYENMDEEKLKELMNGQVRQVGSMLMDWTWLPKDFLSQESLFLIELFKSHFDNASWSRTLSGHEMTSDGTATSFDEFSNLNLSDRFGRIYQMVCFFNLNEYWNSNDDYGITVRINYGFLIYHIMLTILGEFAERENNTNTLNFWSIKQSDINKLFSSNILDLTFLPEEITNHGARVISDPNNIVTNIDHYNIIMAKINDFFNSNPRRIQVCKLYTGTTNMKRNLLLCNISHGTLFTKKIGLDLMNHIKTDIEGLKIMDDGNRNLCLCDEEKQFGPMGVNNFLFVNVALNCTPNTIPIKTAEFTTRKSHLINQVEYATSQYGILDDYITKTIVKTELNRAIGYLNQMGISISIRPGSTQLQSRYGEDIKRQVDAVASGVALTRRLKKANKPTVADFSTDLYKTDTIAKWISEWEDEPDRGGKEKKWKKIISKLKEKGMMGAANYLKTKNTGVLRSDKIENLKKEYPYLMAGGKKKKTYRTKKTRKKNKNIRKKKTRQIRKIKKQKMKVKKLRRTRKGQ